MRISAVGLAAGLALIMAPGAAHAQQAVSFSKDIVPIFREQCSKCHNNRQATGGFSVSTFAAIQKGSKGGKVLAAKPEESRLIKYLHGDLKPMMPPGAPLPKASIDKIAAWIAAGAKADVDPNQVLFTDLQIPTVKVPVIPVKNPVLPQAASLAWSKDGKILAVGTYKTVRLVDPANGQTLKELKGHADIIHSLQFSPDGKLLAAAGGPTAQQGEVKIWDVATGKEVKTISGHTDCIYACSWSPDSKNLATASYDKTIRIWDVATGNELKVLKDHADAVYAVAYNPQGNLLASGSADRSVKVWDVASGKRIYTLTGHTDIVFGVAWNPAGTQLTTVGGDKSVRTWNVNAAAGNAARSMTPHEKTVNTVVYSPDGTMMATASDDKTAKIFKSNGSTQATIKDLGDAVMSVSFSGDNKQVAVGSFDGSVKIFNAADGKPVVTVIDLPKAPEKPAAPAAKPDPKKPAAPAAPAKTDAKKPAMK